MARRYVYEEKQKPGRNTSGYGYIVDTEAKIRWDNQIATLFGKKKAALVTDALNLYEDFSNLKKGCSKREIITLLNKYGIKI